MSIESTESAQEVMGEISRLVNFFERIIEVDSDDEETIQAIKDNEEEMQALVLGVSAEIKTVKTVTFNMQFGGPSVDLVAQYVAEGETCGCQSYRLESVKLLHCDWLEDWLDLPLTQEQRDHIEYFLDMANAEYAEAEGEDCGNY